MRGRLERIDDGSRLEAIMNRNETLRDVISFAATVSVAAWQGWAAKDIIWGLWISSLIIGYSFIVLMIVSSCLHGSLPMRGRSSRSKGAIGGPGETGAGRTLGRILLARAALAPAALFMLGFFTIHFGGFHFVHGLFLNGFFPLVEWNPFGEAPGGVLGGFLVIIGTALAQYWPFVLFSAISRFGDYRNEVASRGEPNMFRPYLNVVRMHLLIFVFAGLHAAGLESYAVYPVLFFYFFPVGSILKAIAPRRGAGPDTSRRPAPAVRRPRIRRSVSISGGDAPRDPISSPGEHSLSGR
jgi:hypothetical protein